MVQGKTKGLQNKMSSSSSSRHAQKAASNMKKGRKAIAPKKSVLIKQASMTKNLSAKINKSIEMQMCTAASSGKLTIMKNVAPDQGGSSSKSKPKPGK